MRFFASAPTPPERSAGDLLALERREILIEAGEADEEVARHFLREVRRARKNDCLVLPPGRYPFPNFSVQLAFRAQRPGSVSFITSASSPGLLVTANSAIAFDGIVFESPESDPVLIVKDAIVALRECTLVGGIQVRGASAKVLVASCCISGAVAGADADEKTSLEINSSCIVGCHFGVSAAMGSKVMLTGCRFEACRSAQTDDPGAAVNATGATLEITGCHFDENDIGMHLQNCGAVSVTNCRFEACGIAAMMLDTDTSVSVRNTAFARQHTSTYPHAILTVPGSRFDFCSFDASTTLPSPALINAPPPAVAREENSDEFTQILREVSELTLHADTRLALENWLHLAHASHKRREQGLPVPTSGQHLVFEDAEEILRLDVADIVARAAATLGIVPNATVAHAPLQHLVFGDDYADRAFEAARGGVLVAYSEPENERSLAREQFSRVRSIVARLGRQANSDTLFVLSGGRDFLRPLVRGDAVCRTLFGITIPFPALTPPELTLVFLRLCARQQISLSAQTIAKVLLVMHLLDDRKDRRFIGVSGVGKFFELAQRRYLERCSREQDFQSPLHASDIESPVDRAVEVILRANPSFVVSCPRCRTFMPWLPELPPSVQCPACGNVWNAEVGVWTGSSFYRQLVSDEIPARKTTRHIFRRGAE